jgi:hypothetical protein
MLLMAKVFYFKDDDYAGIVALSEISEEFLVV